MKPLPIFPVLIVLLGVVCLVTVVKRRSYENNVFFGRITRGMPAADVQRSVGNPMAIIPRKNRTEMWVYPKNVVTFDTGRVTETQEISPGMADDLVRGYRPTDVMRASDYVDSAPPRNGR